MGGMTREIYIIASEMDDTRKKSNIIIECSVPQTMTMHAVYEALKDTVRDFAMDTESMGKDLIEKHGYHFDWAMFADYIRTERTLKYGIEITNVIMQAPSVDRNENLLRDEDLDAIFPEGLL